MKTDTLGIPRFSNKDLIDMIYSGHVDKCHVVLCDSSDDVDKFNTAMREQGLTELTTYVPIDVEQNEFDNALQSEWFMPDKYKDMDISKYLQDKCKTQEELVRYFEEYAEFMRENNIVWGVGRGSSVASYVLYLIGVHKVNSIQFGLDWREFLR
jgi:predicted metal-dependent hydrolase